MERSLALYRGAMTILVDEARWPWRGTYWCHLVTDSDLVELHDFAAQLGSRRVGFQGDHYDIDVVTRDLAIELGAKPCDSRELVRRLKAADLRLRPSQFTKWSLVERAEGRGYLPSDLYEPDYATYVERADGYFVLGRRRESGEHATAGVVYGTASVPSFTEADSLGRYFRVDQAGNWSLEVISPPPSPRE